MPEVRGAHALGRASLLLGGREEAKTLAGQALTHAPANSGNAAQALLLLADIGTEADPVDADASEAPYGRALAIAESRGLRPFIAHCHVGLGGSTGARTSVSRLANTSLRRRRCTARWTCGSTWSRQRRGGGRSHDDKEAVDGRGELNHQTSFLALGFV